MLFMLGLALTLAAAQSEIQQAGASSEILILGDEHQSALLGRLVASASGNNRHYRQSTESGMGYARCVAVWRENAEQSESCIQSRLGLFHQEHLVVVHPYHDRHRQGGVVLTCVSWTGSSRATLPIPPQDQAAALDRCLNESLQGEARASAPLAPGYAVRDGEKLPAASIAEAAMNARSVMVMAIDHVGTPRGITGSCAVDGRIERIEQGSGPARFAPIGVSVPCASMPGQNGRIGMSELREGTFARIYLDDRNALLGFEPLTR